jgi:MSHA biogenesis protein MshO
LRGKAATNSLSSAFRHQSSGFTLVEMIMVIVITGILGGMVAMFLKAPIQQYMDVGRRADMTDIANTASRRVMRDVRLALPNSVSVYGCPNACTLQFIPTSAGGRYRAYQNATGTVPPSGVFSPAPTSTTQLLVMAPPVAVPPIGTGDQVVIYNQNVTDAYTGLNRTAGTNTVGAATVDGTPLNLGAALAFPYASPNQRFNVVNFPVSYVCNPNPANPALGTLTRVTGNSWTYQSTAGTSNLLAKNVSSCSFTYDPSVVAQRAGLVTLTLGISEADLSGNQESVTLYTAAHVSNEP